MPELPEVETVRRGLVPALEGRRLSSVIQRRPDLRWPLPERFAERLSGQRVLRLDRRSKYILAAMESGETLLIHLGMSGRMLIEGSGQGVFHHNARLHGKHDHVIFNVEDGPCVVFNDARRFGAMDLTATEHVQAHKWLAALGPEPLGNGFNAAILAAILSGRAMPIKSALLDQKIVAGLGNIYVCEALFRSGTAPTRKAGSLSMPRIERLTGEIRSTLTDAIAAGGSSLRDFRKADGELGYFQHTFRVYGREGEACVTPDCGGTVARLVQSGRSSFYCRRCQR